ncbi:hypothetical protein [Niabella sp.]|uniref:hypothetical protein n=1 Tax=Niabella sp. TaxID=1962976 RepID=UPI002630AFF5|nr:hypothetical protein [Niabella sp.]
MTTAHTEHTAFYPGFEYDTGTLVKYIEASGIFTILLKGGTVVHFSPEDATGFRSWLQQQGIPDIRRPSGD